MRRAALILALALALAACGSGGPIDIGSKQIPVDITLGESAGARPPALNPAPIGFPGFLQPPIPRPEPGGPRLVPPARACPIANPLDASLLVARASAPLAPAEATYPFRNQGSFSVGGVGTSYPSVTERTVGDVRAVADGVFEFDVSIELLSDTTTTTYRVVDDPDALERGVFITRIITARASGADAFVPHRPIQLMPFPPPEFGTNLEDELANLQGQNYRSAGTDPLTQTTMVLEASITGKTRVDACGEWIDAFEVEVVDGRIVGPDKQITFTGRYAIAPQYGGLVIEDDIDLVGTENFQDIESRNRARITVVPKDARAAG